MSDELYSLEQLSERVADLLADDYDGQRNGRIRDLPNARTIRWYTTIGLVDRPLTTRNRTALYGGRHVLQLAAIKKLQADGLTLAEVQERMLGRNNKELAELADITDLAGLCRIDVTEAPMDAGTAAAMASLQRTLAVSAAAAQQVPAFRIGDSVTILLNSVTRPLEGADIAQLTEAAAPLIDALERLGLTPRKERR